MSDCVLVLLYTNAAAARSSYALHLITVANRGLFFREAVAKVFARPPQVASCALQVALCAG